MQWKMSKIKQSYSSVFNIGTGIPTSINELAQKMIKIFGLDLKPLYKEAKEDKKGIMHSYADTTLARQNLHFVAKKGIETGLREYRAMIRRNFIKIEVESSLNCVNK